MKNAVGPTCSLFNVSACWLFGPLEAFLGVFGIGLPMLAVSHSRHRLIAAYIPNIA
jgi:hypothetical protein